VASNFTDHEAAIEEAEWICENENVDAIILVNGTHYLTVATQTEYETNPRLRNLKVIEAFTVT